MGSGISNNSVVPFSRSSFLSPRSQEAIENYASRLEGIQGIIQLNSTKLPFGQFLNNISMNQNFLSSKHLPGIHKIDSFLFDNFAQIFLGAYKHNHALTNIQINSVLSYLLSSKNTKNLSIVLLHVFPKFIHSQQSKLIPFSTISSFTVTNSERSISSTSFCSHNSLSLQNSSSNTSLNSLILATERIKASLIICSKEKVNDVSYPIVYANQSFCQMTQYSIEDVLGRNPNFLQSNKAEKEARNQMSHALEHGQPCQVVITNFTKENIPFMNLVCLIPIVNEHEEVSFVIGLSFDVTNPGSRVVKQQEAKILIDKIPRMIYSENIYEHHEDSLLRRA